MRHREAGRQYVAHSAVLTSYRKSQNVACMAFSSVHLLVVAGLESWLVIRHSWLAAALSHGWS